MLRVSRVLRPDLRLCMKQVNLEWLDKSCFRWAYKFFADNLIEFCYRSMWMLDLMLMVQFSHFFPFPLGVNTSSPGIRCGREVPWHYFTPTPAPAPKGQHKGDNPFKESTKGNICLCCYFCWMYLPAWLTYIYIWKEGQKPVIAVIMQCSLWLCCEMYLEDCTVFSKWDKNLKNRLFLKNLISHTVC